MIKKTYLDTFEQINNALHEKRVVYVDDGYNFKAKYTSEYGLIKLTDKKGVVYNAAIRIAPTLLYWIEEEVQDPAVKPEVGFVFETNTGSHVYINLKKGKKFYGAELNGKQNSCKVFHEDGHVEKRNIYLVKKIK